MTYLEGDQPRKPYKMPEKIAYATIHYLYGFSTPSHPESVEAYLREKKYALAADLLVEGLSPEQIEEAVNSGQVRVAPVFNSRTTDLYWLPEAEGGLEELAAAAQANSGGNGSDPNAPAFGDVVSIGGVLESQQLALAALAYGAHRGLVLETTIDRGIGVGPLFISKDSPLAALFTEPSGTS